MSALTKRVRFAVFRRDRFTCQYCGQGAPDVALEVDHVTPRCAGGTNDPANLLTACVACNRAKSGRSLTDVETLVLEPCPGLIPPSDVACVGGPLDGAVFRAEYDTAFRWVFHRPDGRYFTFPDALGITRDGHGHVTEGAFGYLYGRPDRAELSFAGVYRLTAKVWGEWTFQWTTPEDFLLHSLGWI